MRRTSRRLSKYNSSLVAKTDKPGKVVKKLKTLKTAKTPKTSKKEDNNNESLEKLPKLPENAEQNEIIPVLPVDNIKTVENGEKLKKIRKSKGRKINKCDICGKVFAGTNDLRKHLRIHNDERPYECPTCKSRFRQSGCLKNHIASQHGTDVVFVCDLCKKQFPITERLRLHMRIHTGERPYQCLICMKSFARGGQVRKVILSFIFFNNLYMQKIFIFWYLGSLENYFE